MIQARFLVVTAILTLFLGSATATTSKRHAFDDALPILGTRFHQLPAGKGKALVEAACLRCHSADMLVQQHLTEKQWTAEVEKMTRWGADVKDADKAGVIAYLSTHLGPDNRFKPYRTRPVGY